MNNVVSLLLLQVWSLPTGAGIPSPATQFFNTPIRGLLLQMNRDPIRINNNDAQYGAHKACQDKYVKGNDTCKDSLSFCIGHTVAVQCEDWALWMYRVIEGANSSDHRGDPK